MRSRHTVISTLLIATVMVFAGCSAQKSMFKASVDYTIRDGVIVLEEPERSPEQHILDIVPEQMVEGYWIMFPGYCSS